ncbi:SDR family NAD(P)-dependent oxidoreductase [Acaryochloris marina NIES-2412]|uniref:SDR family NAD(P)-dependent oxidoreductase n=1 Tax=Acaryochloris marina TaxID=155978 RepID=UPI0040583EB1
MNTNQMDGKRVALVTGSTSGIGEAIATQLIQDNFAVAFHSRSSVTEGQQLAAAHPEAAYPENVREDSNYTNVSWRCVWHFIPSILLCQTC